jgi:hypothetical protein
MFPRGVKEWRARHRCQGLSARISLCPRVRIGARIGGNSHCETRPRTCSLCALGSSIIDPYILCFGFEFIEGCANGSDPRFFFLSLCCLLSSLVFPMPIRDLLTIARRNVAPLNIWHLGTVILGRGRQVGVYWPLGNNSPHHLGVLITILFATVSISLLIRQKSFHRTRDDMNCVPY